MSGQLLSLARLANPRSLQVFKDLFVFHGALGFGHPDRNPKLSEYDRLRITPMVFGLMPKAAVLRDRDDIPVKPIIRSHLTELCISEDEELVDVLKSICDQFYETRKNSGWKKRKLGLKDIRANVALHRRLRNAQNQRCRLCGVSLEMDANPTLDHCIPFRLVGDVPDGSNYQLLCGECNRVKGNYISALMHAKFYSAWYYEVGIESGSGTPAEARYVRLAMDGRCMAEGCRAGPMTARLYVRSRTETGLPVLDNLTVVCDEHQDDSFPVRLSPAAAEPS